jgi:hypothetical protein
MSEENTNEVSASDVEAQKFGWVPKEDFKGDESEWKDSETFLKRGKEINGFLRKDLEKLQKATEADKAAIAEMKATMEEFRKYHNDTEARAYKRALEDLKQQKIEAIEAGQGAVVVAIDEQIENIREAQNVPKETVKQPSQNDNAEYRAWAKENLWYATDNELKAYADLVADDVAAEAPNKKGHEFLEEVTKRVKEAHPDKFINPARKTASVSSSSDGRSPSPTKKKSYNDLPPEARQACDKFVKQKLMTQEQYISEYDWEN